LREIGDPKIRPVVVLKSSPGGLLQVCPISSRAPTDGPYFPLSPRDFLEGGLDICDESYVLVTISLTISPGEVLGKKGSIGVGILNSVSDLKDR
jgi:hypothetical protein